MLNISGFLSDITDEISRRCLQKVQEEFDLNPLIKGQWVLKELTYTKAVTNLVVPHGLSFQPKDVIITYKTGAGTFTVNYASIDATNINVTATDAVNVRLLIGRLGA